MAEPDVHPRVDRSTWQPRPSNPAGSGGPALVPPADGRSPKLSTPGIASQQVADYETVESRWKITLLELEVQKKARTADAARMAEKLSSLEEEREATATQAAAVRENFSQERNLWLTAAAAASVIALVYLCVVSWGNTERTERVMPHPARQAPPTVSPAAAGSELQPGNELPPDPHTALTTAIDLLNNALGEAASRNGIAPEEALRRVSGNGQECKMLLSGDSPSVLFGGEPRRPNALANTLTDCAKAISRLHR